MSPPVGRRSGPQVQSPVDTPKTETPRTATTEAPASQRRWEAGGAKGRRESGSQRIELPPTQTAGSASTPSPLKSEAMKGNAILAQVASGQAVLSSGGDSEATKKMQQALLQAGFKLPRFGADGDFGGETAGALKTLQKEAGLPQTGKLDQATAVALDKLASSKVRYPEYDKMFKDGRLETTLAIGYDEGGMHTEKRRELVAAFDQRGFARINPKGMSEDALKKAGLDPAKVDPDATYFVKSFKAEGKDVLSVVKLVDPTNPNAKKSFADAMAGDELVMYTGHARHGTGPDFNDIHDPSGNFVIGKAYDNAVTHGANDLKKTKMTDGYQMMLFSGCTTDNYRDELRSIPKNKGQHNLDLLTTQDLLSSSTSAGNCLSVLDSVMAMESVDTMKAKLDGRNDGVQFTADGFRANQYQPQ